MQNIYKTGSLINKNKMSNIVKAAKNKIATLPSIGSIITKISGNEIEYNNNNTIFALVGVITNKYN